MKHLLNSFQTHKGIRGVTFYDDTNSNFLTWYEVFRFLKDFPEGEKSDRFYDRLTDTLANYNPETEFLAVRQQKGAVTVELFTRGLG